MKQLFASKYSRAGVDKISEEYLGDSRISSALTHNVLFTSYEINNHISWCFTKSLARRNKRYNFLMRDIARATSAAPTFFDPGSPSPSFFCFLLLLLLFISCH